MKLLFVTDHEYLPDFVSGREYSTHDLSVWLTNKGHNITVLCRERTPRNRLAKKLICQPLYRAYTSYARARKQWSVPYNVVRSSDIFRSLRDHKSFHNTDATILQVHEPLKCVDVLKKYVGHIFIYLRDATYGYELHRLSNKKNVSYIANSKFVSDRYSKYSKRRIPVIYPLIEIDRYKSKVKGSDVLFVNPVREKGVEVALQVAEICSDVPFLFVEGWRQSTKQFRSLADKVSKLPNVRLVRNTNDMRQIYAKGKVLLAPSQWEEGFGRVIVEAQANGIPAVASEIGGLPEAVGNGGVLIPPYAAPDVWAKTIWDMYADTDLYSRYISAAELATDREMLKTDSLGTLFETAIREGIRRQEGAR